MEVVKIIRPQTGKKFVYEFSFVSAYHQDRNDLSNREHPKVCNNECIMCSSFYATCNKISYISGRPYDGSVHSWEYHGQVVE
jgi:hypothetical protein